MGYNEYNDDHILNVCKIAGVDDFVEHIHRATTLKSVKKAMDYLVDKSKLSIWLKLTLISYSFV